MLKKSVTYFGLPTFILFLLTIFPSTSLYAQLAETPWPMFRHDLQHTGRSPYGSIQKPIVKWTFQTQGPITCSPAIGEDGTIYFGSKDKKFYAVTRKGKLKWAFETQGEVESSPAIRKDGTILFGSWDSHLYALNPDSSIHWKYKSEGGIISSPAIAPDGTIYFGSWDKKLHAITPGR